MAHVSDNRKVPVKHAERDAGCHRKYLLHGLKCISGRIDMLFLKHIYQTNQKIIRVADRIVIGINQVVFVFHFRINGHVRQEESLLCRIALFIIKMRTVSVENYKLPGNSFAQFFCYQFQQFVIRGVVIGIPYIFFNEIIRVGFFAEEVYK